MQNKIIAVISLMICLFFSSVLYAVQGDVIAWWKFDKSINDKVIESITDRKDEIIGNHWLVDGVKGQALKLDGLTAYVVRTENKTTALPEEFTIQAWIALGAYPLNWCPVLWFCNEGNYFYLAIGDKGQLGFYVRNKEKQVQLVSVSHLKLRKWYFLTGVLEDDGDLKLYINGKRTTSSNKQQMLEPSDTTPVLIGRFPDKVKPTGGIRKDSHLVTDILFDGIIDEVKMIRKVLSNEKIAGAYIKNQPKNKPELPERVLPAGPKGKGKFGAYYTRLKYYQGWDALWRVSEHPDVVIRFDKAPFRFVFWRGTSYIPNWVTGNGIWYNNEFMETWGHGAVGCAEPMSDKQCRNSHVRIIESTDARAVVHWRYALVDNYYNIARVDDATGWGDWADEIYIIYPDGVGIRKIILHSSDPAGAHEWHEGIMVLGPGQRPEDILHSEALTLANMKGQSKTYSWADGPPRLGGIENPNIHLINTKSQYKPFVIVRLEDEPHFGRYGGEIRPDVSIFPWWNHWPTAQNPSDGRYAMAADRAAHSSLTHIEWKEYSKTENTMTKIMLNGMTKKEAGELATLGKSWTNPARLKLKGDGFKSSGYDQSERVYKITKTNPSNNSALSFELIASTASPVVNPAFMIENWSRAGSSVKIDGKKIDRGQNCRTGHTRTLESDNLIVWLKLDSKKPVNISIKPVSD